ncbi:alanine racemase [Legionella beliardensis]|uniref:Alanine racemase n=1 Tax=Legionella beliardensis TaxID=91822 RepID=A0A378I1T0_9GAMM|nr:alanine racemase [Legionella beliardensis]STX28671.1 alanine racemase [Legionella beliardensis]
MTRPTYVQIDKEALLHNLAEIKHYAPGKKIIAMVKANAYGCGLQAVVPVLDGQVYAFGVACAEEAIAIRKLGIASECILFQGIFSADELIAVSQYRLQCVIHQAQQLQWLLANPQPHKIKVWVKINTGMHRLGFAPEQVYSVVEALQNCPWVDAEIGVMTHLACADEPTNPVNQVQLARYHKLKLPAGKFIKSIANSAAIIAIPEAQAEVVRPGIMLYGVSPFLDKSAAQLGLKPVLTFVSAISAIHHYPAGVPIGYGGIWRTKRPSIIGVVAVGYGDGFPRHISSEAHVWINGFVAPIVGRVSMDILTIDLTDYPHAKIGDAVELWGKNIPVESVAKSANTIPYELLCQLSPRVHHNYKLNCG